MKGFTLVEVLVVCSLAGILIGISFLYGIDVFTQSLARIDRELLLTSLREARAEAMNGSCVASACTFPTPQGIHVSSTGLTIFEGDSFASRNVSADIPVPFSLPESIAARSATEVVFAPYSANVTHVSFISMLGADHRAEEIEVLNNGTIVASSTTTSYE